MPNSAGASAVLAEAVTETANGPTAVSGRSAGSGLAKRFASAAIMLPLALAAMWFGGLVFTVLVALAGLLMVREWLRFADALPKPPVILLLWLPLAVALLALEFKLWTVMALAGAVFLCLLPAMVRQHWRWAVAGGLYVGLPCLCLVWLRGDPDHGRLIVFWTLVVVWSTDTGAYAFGRLLGGPKLIPALSPNKTWAGLLGGMICAGLAGYGMALLDSALPAVYLGLFGAVVAVVAQAGDFFESGIKRHFGVKDSGSLIPGHGGVLDRLDGVMFAAPFAALGIGMFGGVLWP